MKAAVMQPYLFPYIGYYQLAAYVDKFVVYDDANYITRGFINRNSILDQGKSRRITFPIPGASIHKPISALHFSPEVHKPLEGIRHAYNKAPYFNEIYPMIREVLTSDNRSISDICMQGIDSVMHYLGRNISLIKSSSLEYDIDLPATDRLIEISRRCGATHYINSIGGRELYDRAYFQSRGLDLTFLQPKEIHYIQGNSEFVANLSMIDTLMWCGKDKTNQLMDQYELV